MAKKKSFFGTLLRLGGLAAATAAVYYRRDEIKAFLADAAGRLFPEEPETEPVEEMIETEPDIIIDATAKAEETEKTEETAAAE